MNKNKLKKKISDCQKNDSTNKIEKSVKLKNKIKGQNILKEIVDKESTMPTLVNKFAKN